MNKFVELNESEMEEVSGGRNFRIRRGAFTRIYSWSSRRANTRRTLQYGWRNRLYSRFF